MGKIVQRKELEAQKGKAPAMAEAFFFSSINRIADWRGSDCIFSAFVL
jgi:hypothetical protein